MKGFDRTEELMLVSNGLHPTTLGKKQDRAHGDEWTGYVFFITLFFYFFYLYPSYPIHSIPTPNLNHVVFILFEFPRKLQTMY